MELRVALTDDDLKAFAAYRYRRWHAFRRASRIVALAMAFTLIIVIVAVILVVIAMTGGVPRPVSWDLTIPITGLTMFGYLLFIWIWQMKRNGWKVLAKQPGIFDEWGMEIHAEAFRERSRQIDTFRRWDWFTSIERDRSHTYLTVRERPVVILPDRAFPSAQDAQHAYEEMCAYWDAVRRDASTTDQVGQARSSAEQTAP